jgi:hypothetical protein
MVNNYLILNNIAYSFGLHHAPLLASSMERQYEGSMGCLLGEVCKGSEVDFLGRMRQVGGRVSEC